MVHTCGLGKCVHVTWDVVTKALEGDVVQTPILQVFEGDIGGDIGGGVRVTRVLAAVGHVVGVHTTPWYTPLH